MISTYLNKHARLCLVFSFLVSALFVSGCEEPFQPIEENHEYFYSVWGYLDANADTQWVRVMPVRETTEYSQEPIDATVTLEDLDTGEITTMYDSLFVLSQVAEGDAYVWNFWTTMDISPSNSYKLTVERSDGAITTTTVDIPEQYPDPTIESHYLTFSGIDNIAEARLNWRVLDRRDNTVHRFSIIQERITYYQHNDRYLLAIYPNDDFVNHILKSLDAVQPQIQILETNVFITVGGSDWINFSELERGVIALPEATSNIENGVGYMVGTIVKKLSYPTCVGDGGEIIPC